jgi:molecular chaperone Hsp33
MTTQNPKETASTSVVQTYTNDQLQRYLFDNKHARGELVQLKQCYQSILVNHNYPQGVKQLLGELLVATSLLTATLKFAGEISVQLQGDGPVGYMVVNSTMLSDDKNADNNHQQMRGIAKLKNTTNAVGLRELIGKGNMVITIRPNKGEAYQGVVALEQPTLAECLSHYFAVSEQIPTQISLFTDVDKELAAGCLLQLLPDGNDKEQQLADFEHLAQLTSTIKADEIFTLSANELLYRLYHQEVVQLYQPQAISYKCGCSADKCLTAIAQMEPDDIKSILAEQGKISMTCEYCQTTYDFDEQKLAGLIKKH